MSYYEDHKPTHIINVLGTNYAVYVDVPVKYDDYLDTCAGYCDKTAKRIAVMAEPDDNELIDWLAYQKECLRHELLHAFMHESGIGGNVRWDVPGEEHPEHMIEWISIQFPKLLKAFQKAGAL